MNSSSSPEEFATLQDALKEWTPMRDRREAWPEIEKIVSLLNAELGEITRIHIPDGQSYVAVTFENEPSRIGAYINVGHVDHLVQIQGSHVPHAAPSFWRTLMTASRDSTGGDDVGEVEHQLCPNCNLQIPKAGACGCGWEPSSN